MSVERHWGAMALMNLRTKEPATKEGTERITTTSTTSPKTPPKAPPATFSRDPIRSSGESIRGEYPKGNIQKGNITTGEIQKVSTK